MRRLLPAAAAPLVVLLALTGCATPSPVASAPTPAPTVTEAPAPEASPSATTPQVRVVGPGERPPLVLGGDCEAAITATELSDIVGYEVSEISLRDPKWTRTLDNVGGIRCEWQGGNFSVVPLHAVEGADARGSEDSGLADCGWHCAWLWESDRLSVSGWLSDAPARGRAGMDAVGAEIGEVIDSRVGAETLRWQRDVRGWWDPTDCAAAAGVLSGKLGGEVTGSALGYTDPPGVSTILADQGSRAVTCRFSIGDDVLAVATFVSGDAWAYPYFGEDPNAAAVDLGVSGVQAHLHRGGAAFVNGDTWEMTDGVNTASIEIGVETPWSPDLVAEAFAEMTGERSS